MSSSRISRSARRAARRPLIPDVHGTLKGWLRAAGDFWKRHDRVVLDDRRRDAPLLVSVLTGYKPDLLPFVIPRLRSAMPDADVCLPSPDLRNEGLAALCGREGWTYLSTPTNDLVLAQNVCFQLDEAAEMIVKIDEGMLLRPDTDRLLSENRDIEGEGSIDPGFVAPIIPLTSGATITRAGHFSFGLQYAGMKALLERSPGTVHRLIVPRRPEAARGDLTT